MTALSSALRSVTPSASFEQFKLISNLTDENVLPQKAIFAFDAIDPRYLSAPKRIHSINSKKEISVDAILKLQNDYPQEEIRNILLKLCDPECREMSYKNQNTLKELSSRRQKLLISTPQKRQIQHDKDSDPSIPLLIAKRPRTQDWVIILPWFWLLPLWHQINRVPRVYHFGLRQYQQLQYEQRQLYFPDDYPFTNVGFMENSLYKRQSLKSRWLKKPIGKRVNYDKINGIHSLELPAFSGEIGDYFSCDWELLRILRNGIDFLTSQGKELKLIDSRRTTQFDSNDNSRAINTLNDVIELYKDVRTIEPGTSSTEELPVTLASSLPTPGASLHATEIKNESASLIITQTTLPIVAISCNFIERGHPHDNARIYRIPDTDLSYWLQVANGVYRADGKKDHEQNIPKPSVIDLIGFVTTATYHLGEGNGLATGFIDAHIASTMPLEQKYILVRNVGTNIYRLAHWEQIIM